MNFSKALLVVAALGMIGVAIAAVCYWQPKSQPDRTIVAKTDPAPEKTNGIKEPVPTVPTLAELLAPGGCEVAAAADDFTKDIHEVMAQLLAGNSGRPFPVVVESSPPSINGDRVKFTGLVRRTVRMSLSATGKGRFMATLNSDVADRKSRKSELAVLAAEPDPLLAVEPDAPLRTDTSLDQLLACLADPNRLSGVVVLSGPSSARRVESRLKDVIGIDIEPFSVTLELIRAEEPNVRKLTIKSPECDLHFERTAKKWVLHRFARPKP